jgi:transcription antitermination factor NusG
MRHAIGEQVRINEGRFYGRVGVIIAVREAITGVMYTVRHAFGTEDCSSVIHPHANNGD